MDAPDSLYSSFPSGIDKEVKWVEPYDTTFFPFDRCQSVSDFKIVKVRELVENYDDQVPASELMGDIWGHDYLNLIPDLVENYTCLKSVVSVTYQVTCLNKLKYEGTVYLFSKPHEINTKWCEKEVCAEFRSHAHDWQEKPLDFLNDSGVYYDKVSPEFDGYNVFNKDTLLERWSRQKVAYPEWKYLGEAKGKLVRPVLFIHGLNDDYETWGVESVIEKGEKGENKGKEEFQKGLVKRYRQGSAPDIIARSQKINVSEESINHNGIYFFSSSREV